MGERKIRNETGGRLEVYTVEVAACRSVELIEA